MTGGVPNVLPRDAKPGHSGRSLVRQKRWLGEPESAGSNPAVLTHRKENRSLGPDLSRKQCGRREVWLHLVGVRVLFPPLVWKLNRARREPGRYPVRAPRGAWCASHPASAVSFGVEFVIARVGGRYWLAARVRKTRPFRRWGFNSLPTHRDTKTTLPSLQTRTDHEPRQSCANQAAVRTSAPRGSRTAGVACRRASASGEDRIDCVRRIPVWSPCASGSTPLPGLVAIERGANGRVPPREVMVFMRRRRVVKNGGPAPPQFVRPRRRARRFLRA